MTTTSPPLETSRLEQGVAYDFPNNESAAGDWATANCEPSDGKRFGDCEVDGGVAMQERAGEAVLLTVALDVRVVGPDGEIEFTVVVEVGG